MHELLDIQLKLKAPKGQVNKFGNYEYRSTEDILEAVKPLLKEHSCLLTLSDDIQNIDGRFYVKSTAAIYKKNEGSEEAPDHYTSVYGWAREPEQQKGMSAPQVTAMTSSYARKLALNGLFCIDDTKEIDGGEPEIMEPKPIPSEEKIISVLNACDTLELLASKYQKALNYSYTSNQKIASSYQENRARLT